MIQTKSSRIEIRTSEDAKMLIEKAASLTGETLSSYILNKSLSSAQKDVERMESITVRNQDRDMFFSLLVNPPEPNEALKDLFKKDKQSQL